MAKTQRVRVKRVPKRAPALQPELPLLRIGRYLLLVYWLLCIVIYFTVDIFLDLYTTTDFMSALRIAAVISVPFTAITLYLVREELLHRWYTCIFYPVLTFGIYLGCSYFNVLNADLLLSAAFRPYVQQVVPVQNVQQVVARKIGFIHTDVTLYYSGKPVIFQGTRTSYFLLLGKKTLKAGFGQSYLGNQYAVGLQLPARERWLARGAYAENWFHRYLWVLIGVPLLFGLSRLKDKFFPKAVLSPGASLRFRKFTNLLLIVILSVIGLTIVVLLLAYFFL